MLSMYLVSQICQRRCGQISYPLRASILRNSPSQALRLHSSDGSKRFGRNLPNQVWNSTATKRNSILPLLCRKPVNRNFGILDEVHNVGRFQRISFPKLQGFHTTSRQNIPPVIWMILKPMAKLSAILTGRGFRKWWQSLPDKKRQYFWEVIKNSWKEIVMVTGVFVSLFALNYYGHLQEAPITKRKRFIAFTEEQFMSIVDFECKQHLEENKDNLLPEGHPLLEKVVQTAMKLVNANMDLPEMRKHEWTVAVVKSDEENAFVLPNGYIFVFTGLLKRLNNEDQLGNILGHEMTHALLQHGAEQVSYAQLLDYLVIVIMAAIWTFIPSDGIALVTQWFFNKVVQVFMSLPYSRALETEADAVGVMLAAKACFDVRESSAFWTLMSIESTTPDVKALDWLSTHPSHDDRSRYLDEVIIPEAIKVRDQCNCKALPRADPRKSATLQKAMIEAHRRNEDAEPIPVDIGQLIEFPRVKTAGGLLPKAVFNVAVGTESKTIEYTKKCTADVVGVEVTEESPAGSARSHGQKAIERSKVKPLSISSESKESSELMHPLTEIPVLDCTAAKHQELSSPVKEEKSVAGNPVTGGPVVKDPVTKSLS